MWSFSSGSLHFHILNIAEMINLFITPPFRHSDLHSEVLTSPILAKSAVYFSGFVKCQIWLSVSASIQTCHQLKRLNRLGLLNWAKWTLPKHRKRLIRHAEEWLFTPELQQFRGLFIPTVMIMQNPFMLLCKIVLCTKGMQTFLFWVYFLILVCLTSTRPLPKV